MSYRKSLLTLAVAALALTLSLEASALLRIGGGGTSSSTKTCPDGTKVPSDSTCPGSTLGGSTWGLYWTGDLPANPLFADKLPSSGPLTQLLCTQKGTSIPCAGPSGQLPSIVFTGTLTFKKGKTNTITASGVSLSASAGFPTSPGFHLQVVGSSNNGVYEVTAVDDTVSQTVYTVGGKLSRNETTVASLGLADATLTFAGFDNATDAYARVYIRLFTDPDSNGNRQPVTDCTLPPIANTTCDGAASLRGSVNTVRVCTGDGDNFTLPCTFTAFVGDGQTGALKFSTGEHNFFQCSGGSDDCYLFFSDPTTINGGVLNKFFPATADLAKGQSFKTTVTAGASASTILQRACNSQMSNNSTPPTTFDCARLTRTSAQGLVEVVIEANPNPVNTGGSTTSVITIKAFNNDEANLDNINVSSVVLILRNAGAKETVPNDGTPDQCTGNSNCWNFKFNKHAVLCAAAKVLGRALTDGESVPIELFGEYTAQTGGGITGTTLLVVNGNFDPAANNCPQ